MKDICVKKMKSRTKERMKRLHVKGKNQVKKE